MKSTLPCLFIGLLLLVACAPGGGTTETAAPLPVMSEPTAAVDLAPPALDEPQPTAEPVTTAAGVAFGRNDDGTFFHGAPGAPVTLIDYSDFL